MKSKRRLRAVVLSTLVVFACLTAIPAPSEAFITKLRQPSPYTPTVGDPDQPDYGMVRIHVGSWLFRLVNTGSACLASRFFIAVERSPSQGGR